ncbi:LysR substrate-binding domain-containing protein [Ferrovibrio sp.]|uniref:LysR substrate-binding domain-containing protein n=1 Tax=Ferrovibrio sp. TaxID=1917215 RepID=UPI001B4B2E01|nr:LysR substrate-binding domain-containing protein [Ferrovibrio sp.]MBP7065947.1 LysR family transcriptional regulator [Ferrovibrio sp.]
MARRLPPLNGLRAFEAAARLGGFVAAAEELSVTPAAVSQQVKGLEQQLGLPLFRRAPNGLTLTEAGRAYLPALSDGFDRLAEASHGLATAAQGGRVCISLLPALASGWLVPRLGQFRRVFPGVALRLDTNRRLTDFDREEVDLVIRFGPWRAKAALPKGLAAYRLMAEEVHPVASPALRLGGRDLADLPPELLLHDTDIGVADEQPWLSWPSWYRRAGLPPPDPARGIGFTDSSVLLSAALAGQGVVLGRLPHLGDLLARGHLVRIGQQSWQAEWVYQVVAPEAHFRRPLLRAVLDWLLRQQQP